LTIKYRLNWLKQRISKYQEYLRRYQKTDDYFIFYIIIRDYNGFMVWFWIFGILFVNKQYRVYQ